jgi:uncharacterized protein YfiM (DUF2279 family)
LVSDLTEARLAADKLSVSLEIAEQKEKMSNITSQGRSQAMGANTVAAEALRKEYQAAAADVEALETFLADLDEQLKLVTDRKDSSTASTAAAAAATKLELEFLRTQNALIESGVAASEAETIVREKKTQLQLQSKGLTAAEADEYIALGNAIDEATEAEKRRQAALMASTKIGVEDDPMLLKLDAQKRGQALILEEQ